MRSTERLVVYGALLGLSVLNVVYVLGGAGPSASAAAGLEELGPADGLRLSGEPALVVRNSGGRAAWGEHPSARAYSFAFVHLGRPLSKLLDSEKYAEQRDQLVEELRTRFEELRARFEELQRQYGSLKPDDPQAGEAQQAFNELVQARQQWEAESVRRQDKLRTEQIEEAYRLIVDAVEVVAAKKEIDVVYRFVPTDLPFDTESPQQAQMTIQARTALRYPPPLDITDDIMEEMALESE
jgi:Skp family chaperone for outer membrane proteins